MLLAIRAGRLDWRQVGLEISPREFEEWLALALIEGWAPGDEWRKVGTICSATHNTLRLTAANGLLCKEEDLRTPESYAPTYGKEEPIDSKPRFTVEEMEARAEARYG